MTSTTTTLRILSVKGGGDTPQIRIHIQIHIHNSFFAEIFFSGKGPPQKQANAPLNMDNFSLNKCPKPSWQGFRPPKNKQIPV